MCRACWVRVVDGRPWCEGCIAMLERPPSAALYVGFAAVALLLGIVAVRSAPLPVGAEWEGTLRLALYAIGGVSLLLATGWLYRRSRRRQLGRVIGPRGETSPPEPGGSYRGAGRVRRAARRVAPPVSGRAATAVVTGALGLSAALVPAALSLPRWIESEIVLAIWWAVWTVSFTLLLHRGWRLARDHEVGDAPPEPPPPSERSRGRFDWGLGAIDGGVADGEGCLVLLAILALIGVTLLAAWLLVELVIPGLVLLAYAVVLRGLAQVANDRHGCEGRPLRALGWGALWATVYTLPLALVVAALHVVFALGR